MRGRSVIYNGGVSGGIKPLRYDRSCVQQKNSEREKSPTRRKETRDEINTSLFFSFEIIKTRPRKDTPK